MGSEFLTTSRTTAGALHFSVGWTTIDYRRELLREMQSAPAIHFH
jgi:hypothetical protein